MGFEDPGLKYGSFMFNGSAEGEFIVPTHESSFYNESDVE